MRSEFKNIFSLDRFFGNISMESRETGSNLTKQTISILDGADPKLVEKVYHLCQF